MDVIGCGDCGEKIMTHAAMNAERKMKMHKITMKVFFNVILPAPKKDLKTPDKLCAKKYSSGQTIANTLFKEESASLKPRR